MTIHVKGAGLVRILTIPQRVGAFETQTQVRGEPGAAAVWRSRGKVGSDGRVVRRRVRESTGGELRSRLGRGVAVLGELGEHAAVVAGIADDRYTRMNFRRGPKHRGTADVDVLHDVLVRRARVSGSSLERVEVDD